MASIKDNRESPYDYYVEHEKSVREYQIAVERKNIIRERLAHCFRTEGVNNFENCKELRETYLALCMDRFHGMIFAEGTEPTNRAKVGVYLRQEKL